ncbi:MAG TPA: tetratricopeptide repeat protein [Bryobacteraceae bacterium]|nr:tetratricopeptide repeat protein [Bryobacteraceae bacterium]
MHLLILSAAAIALYTPTLWNGWVTDDESEVLTDPYIRSFAKIPQIFNQNVWFFAQIKVSNYYRPLKLLAYSVEYHLFGFRPVFWHLANILTNVAVIVVVYLLVKELASRSLAFWAALFFAFHAIHAEAVAWVAAGQDLQCSLMLLLSLWLYHRARLALEAPPAENNWRRLLLLYSASVLLFLAGLFFKETALTFPAVLAAYDFFFRRESLRELSRGWRRYLAYLLAVGVYLAMRIHALHGWAPQTRPWHMTAADMAFSVPVLAVNYLWASLVPINLNYWHVYHPFRALGWKPAAAAAICLVLVWAMFWLRRRQPPLSFALAWFWLTLIPVLDIPKVGQNVFADRYLYIPTLGFSLFAASAWLWIRSRAERPRTRVVAYAALTGVLTFYCGLIFQRLPYWKDTPTLILRTAQQSPDSPEVNGYLSALYKDQRRFTDALRYGRVAIQDDPTNPYFYHQLGEVYMNEGLYKDALVYFDQAVKIQPDFPAFWVNVGAVYNATHQWQQAAEASRRGLAVGPDSSMLLDQLGIALLNDGHPQEAVAAWRRAIQVSPEDIESHVNLATYLFQSGQLNEASAQLIEALKRSPNVPNAFVAHFKLGNIYEMQGFWQAAAQQYEAALQQKPVFQDAALRLKEVREHLPNLGR